MASARRNHELALMFGVSASCKMDLLLPKSEPVGDTGGASLVRHLGKCIKYHTAAV